MNETDVLLILLAALGAAVVLLATIAIWRHQPLGRLHRGLRRVLEDEPQGVLASQHGRKGVAFNFMTKRIAVAWGAGSWGLVYEMRDLAGAQVIVDGQVAGFAYCGQARWPYHLVGGVRRRVSLRLIFDDLAYPDFVLELWRRGDTARRGAGTQEEALVEATYWLTRVASLLNRPNHSWWEPRPVAGVALEQPEQQPTAAIRKFQSFQELARKERAA
jgi:hypothetical protein